MKYTEETIFNYLDNQLTEKEAALFEQEVNDNSELKSRLTRLKVVHDAMAKQRPLSPSQNFTDRVMHSITTLEYSTGKFFNRNRIFVLALTGMVILSAVYFLQIQFYPGIGSMMADEVTLQKITVNLNSVRTLLNSDFIFKLVFYVNGIIGLLLLERAVLKPYFERRKQRYSM